jgi:hypothetical protein
MASPPCSHLLQVLHVDVLTVSALFRVSAAICTFLAMDQRNVVAVYCTDGVVLNACRVYIYICVCVWVCVSRISEMLVRHFLFYTSTDPGRQRLTGACVAAWLLFTHRAEAAREVCPAICRE